MAREPHKQRRDDYRNLVSLADEIATSRSFRTRDDRIVNEIVELGAIGDQTRVRLIFGHHLKTKGTST